MQCSEVALIQFSTVAKFIAVFQLLLGSIVRAHGCCVDPPLYPGSLFFATTPIFLFPPSLASLCMIALPFDFISPTLPPRESSLIAYSSES